MEPGYHSPSNARATVKVTDRNERLGCRPALGPTQTPIQWIPGVISPVVKRQWREAKDIPASSAEVKNEGSCIATPLYVSMAGIGTTSPSSYTQIR